MVDGVVFAMDSQLQVSALRLSDGRVGWRQSLMPASEREGIFGGGLAYGDNILLAGTGSGRLIGLKPSNGDVIWQRRLPAPLHGGPAVDDGNRVFAATIDNTVAADLASGQKLWEHEGREGLTTVLGVDRAGCCWRCGLCRLFER